MSDKIEGRKLKCPETDCEHEGDALDMVIHLQDFHKYTEKDAMKIVYPSGDSPLVDAAKKAGAVSDDDIDKAFKDAPTTKDIIGVGKIDFHNELPRMEFAELVGQEFLLHHIMMVDGWDGYFGTSSFGLILIQFRDGRKCTSLAGGVAVVKQLRNLTAKRKFPVKVKLTQMPGQAGPYYLFE